MPPARDAKPRPGVDASVVVTAAPVITSTLTASGTVGVAFSYAIGATNSPASYAVTGLPAGFAVDPATGLITGIASVSGTISVTITVTNPAGSGSATLTMNVITLQDAWRLARFGSIGGTGSAADSADPDNDGFTNAQEYILGANPLVRDGPALVFGNGTLSFTARTSSGPGYDNLTRLYTVETSADLANPNGWQPLAGYVGIVGSGQTVAFP